MANYFYWCERAREKGAGVLDSDERAQDKAFLGGAGGGSGLLSSRGANAG